jgi:hypothetical protein
MYIVQSCDGHIYLTTLSISRVHGFGLACMQAKHKERDAETIEL